MATSYGNYTDLKVTLDNYVAVAEIQRPPHNFFDYDLIEAFAECFEDLAEDNNCRAIVMCAAGKNFCAGANFNQPVKDAKPRKGHLYQEAVRLFRTPKPIIGAIQGAAVGGGLGLALVPDFRVASPEARFSANFTRLGFHPGFGLTTTLPEVIGKSRAELMFYTSRRIQPEQALQWGLVDMIVPAEELRDAAIGLATEIAECSPISIMETRKTMRRDLADRVKAATDHELSIQDRLRQTEDFKEGVAAMTERRVPNWKGR
jgi:enoyl-CoA hydratase/carnithine racemase